TKNIADTALNLKLNNLQLPGQMAQENMSLFNMPYDTSIDQMSRSLSPMSFLRVGGSQPFQYGNMPTEQPIAGAGSLALQAVSGTGNAALNAWLQGQQKENYRKIFSGLGIKKETDTTPGSQMFDGEQSGADEGAAEAGYGDAAASDAISEAELAM